MKIPSTKLPHRGVEWSNRILILSLTGIAYLTLFPFRFNFEARPQIQPSLLYLGTSPKNASSSDLFLNVLLFVPFGFGVSSQVKKRGGARWVSLLAALAAGAIVSYTVEVLQLHIPSRDSGWDDVISNSMGSVAGFFLFELCGGFFVEQISKCEGAGERWLSPHRTVALLILYFGVWIGVSVLLQGETRLSNWVAQCFLVVGNDASGQNPWKGQVYRLQIWNRALVEKEIARLSSNPPQGEVQADQLASYDFAASQPYADQRNFLPPLDWTAGSPVFLGDPQPALDDRFRLSTKIPVENLTRAIQKTNQFTVRIVCAPTAGREAGGQIVSLSQSEENVNFLLRQEDSRLILWFRNPLSETRSILAWDVANVFEGGESRDIIAAYDGSNAFLYVNGARVPEKYRLGPGASLAHHFFTIRTMDLEGYTFVYETLIFLPAGLLIGLAARRRSRQNTSGGWTLALMFFLPAVLLEMFLAGMSGRRIGAGNIVFSVLLSVAGTLLMNADLRSRDSSTPGCP